MEDQILTSHFKLSEFEYSETAIKNGIDNHCPSTLIPNLKTLCQEVLEPLREHIGKPVIISSGYRSSELNRLVGGVKNSQHKYGRAVDICLKTQSMLLLSFAWLSQEFHDKYKILLESKNNKQWIHIELRRK